MTTQPGPSASWAAGGRVAPRGQVQHSTWQQRQAVGLGRERLPSVLSRGSCGPELRALAGTAPRHYSPPPCRQRASEEGDHGQAQSAGPKARAAARVLGQIEGRTGPEQPRAHAPRTPKRPAVATGQALRSEGRGPGAGQAGQARAAEEGGGVGDDDLRPADVGAAVGGGAVGAWWAAGTAGARAARGTQSGHGP